MALVNNQLALNTVYNHFLTNYAPSSTSKYDAHKKSELRSIYNSIVKMNKESPSYLIDTSRDTQEFAVGMKENARALSNTISSLSTQETGDVLNKKIASSSNEDQVTARYIGNDTSDENIGFELGVKQLASTQQNLGNFMSNDAVSLDSGAYSFDIHINNSDFEFQFNINDGDTNRSLQTKLSNLLNRSYIGIESSVIEDEEGNSALRIESTATGNILDSADSIFQVSDDKTSHQSGAVSYLGLDYISKPSTNALFTLNGEEKSAYSNTFTIDKKFELTLNNITAEDSPVTIGLKPDIESMKGNISQLVDGYNSFLDKANAYSGTNVKTGAFFSDMKRLSLSYQNSLDSMGLQFQDDGSLSIDSTLLSQSLSGEDKETHYNDVCNFTTALARKAGQITLDPMNYVQKTVVAYKNPRHSFANPYITSMYSGMMFNSYC